MTCDTCEGYGAVCRGCGDPVTPSHRALARCCRCNELPDIVPCPTYANASSIQSTRDPDQSFEWTEIDGHRFYWSGWQQNPKPIAPPPGAPPWADCLVACWQVRYGTGFAASDVIAEHDDANDLKAAKKENALRSLQYLIAKESA